MAAGAVAVDVVYETVEVAVELVDVVYEAVEVAVDVVDVVSVVAAPVVAAVTVAGAVASAGPMKSATCCQSWSGDAAQASCVLGRSAETWASLTSPVSSASSQLSQ